MDNVLRRMYKRLSFSELGLKGGSVMLTDRLLSMVLYMLTSTPAGKLDFAVSFKPLSSRRAIDLLEEMTPLNTR